MRNTFGTLYMLTTFGESHGEGVGGVIDGMPSGVAVDEAFIQRELDRRRPGQSPLTTGRKEPDKVRLLSGIFEGKTTGTPIRMLVPRTMLLIAHSIVRPMPTIPIRRSTASATIAEADALRPASHSRGS